MDKYFYLISQFPELFYNKKTDTTVEYFLQEASKWLGEKDFLILDGASSDIELLKSYGGLEMELQKDIAQWRTRKKSGAEYRGIRLSSTFFIESNPLDLELSLIKIKWDFLEENSRQHHYDLESVIIYFLKLKLLQRKFSFDNEAGFKKYQKIYKEQL